MTTSSRVPVVTFLALFCASCSDGSAGTRDAAGLDSVASLDGSAPADSLGGRDAAGAAEDASAPIGRAGVIQCRSATFPAGGGSDSLLVYRIQIETTGDDSYLATIRNWWLTPEGKEGFEREPQQFVLQATGALTADGIALSFDRGDLRVEAIKEPHPVAMTGQLELDGDPGVEITCWYRSWTPAYLYDAAAGGCVDANGRAGRQTIPIAMLRETGNGECGIIGSSCIDAAALQSKCMLDEREGAYAALRDWNLRGADLSAAGITFATLVSADLSGADLTGFFGTYGGMGGTFDTHTVIPDTLDCVTDGARLQCSF